MSATDQERLRTWVDGLLSEPSKLPVRFLCGGSVVRGIPQSWSPKVSLRRLGPTLVEKSYEGRDAGTGVDLRVEVFRYLDFPVVEWTAWLTNLSAHPSPLIHDLVALDATFNGTDGALCHCNGDFYNPDGYTWQTTPIEGHEGIDISPTGGRPCDGAFPYFRLLFKDGGLTLAVGWPGQWHSRFTDTGDGILVQAGQQSTNMRLSPGEMVRTPRIAVMAWAGGEDHAVNLWRRWYREHVMPRPSGRRLPPLLAVTGTDEGEEFTGATEANQLEYQRRFSAEHIDYDVWWIDAGWYPCADEQDNKDWTITGTWRPDPDRFPNGLTPVSEGAARHGARLLVWFEPERVFPGTEVAREHPDWTLDRPRADNPEGRWRRQALSVLLRLSDPACRAWLTDFISGLITAYGIGVYRQDFNFAPLEYWRSNDAPDRQGMTENFYVQGYLAFWDELLERHPDLLIDSCASGGRRNDLETMRRSVPLHYTDYGYGQHPTKLDFHRTMFEWLPYFKESSLSWDISDAIQQGLDAAEGDSFAYHCAFAPMLAPSFDVKRPDHSFETLRKMVRLWRSIADIMLDGDYYPLTPPGRTGNEWVIWQFNRPCCPGQVWSTDGFVQAIRLAEAEEARRTVPLKGLRHEVVYALEESETGERRELPGASLLTEGLAFELGRRRGSVWTYREKKPQ